MLRIMEKAVNPTDHPAGETVPVVAGIFRVIPPHARNRSQKSNSFELREYRTCYLLDNGI